MNFDRFKELMCLHGDKLGIMFTEKQLKQFFNYMNLIINWNEKINLTAITDPEEIILKHFIDSLTIVKVVNDADCVVDVGTGAGFPGIPLKICMPDLKIVLVDSLNKRINFLNTVIDELGLFNITTVHSRVEEFARNDLYREKFDVVTARAVANLSVLSEYLLPLVCIGGKCVCMKGSQIDEEFNNGKKAVEVLGGEVDMIEEFKLPNSDISRNLVVIKKVKHTPKKFPRKPGIPSKDPIA